MWEIPTYIASQKTTGISRDHTHGNFLREFENPVPGGSKGFGSIIDLEHGNRAVVAANGKVYFYDADTGALQNTYTLPPSDFDAGWIVSKAELSGDTAAVHISFVGGGAPEYTLVINAATGELLHQIAPAGISLDESGTRAISRSTGIRSSSPSLRNAYPVSVPLRTSISIRLTMALSSARWSSASLRLGD